MTDNIANIDDILKDFHSSLFQMVKICKKIDPKNPDVDFLQNKLSLARSIDPLLIMNNCKNKLWEYRKHIIDEDEEFFMNHDFNIDVDNKEIIDSFVTLFKNYIKKLSPKEKALVWALIKKLLECVAKYKKEIKDFV